MEKTSSIYIAGHSGLIGSAIVRKLKEQEYNNLLLPTCSELDLRDQVAVRRFFKKNKPEFIFMTAGKVGGIQANSTYPAEFIYDNTIMAINVIHNAYIAKAKKLVFSSCSCVYPRNCPQPMKEEYLLTAPVEKTNYASAIAKITGMKMCQAYREQYNSDFISITSTNIYGPGDKYDLENSHVIAALIKKFLEAKEKSQEKVTLWGTGNPKREFLYSDDLAGALIFLINNYSQAEHINIGTGIGVSIKEIAEIIKRLTVFKGKILWDRTKPDGVPKKLLDSSKINALGWKAKTGLEKGLEKTIAEYIKNKDSF